MKRGIMVMMMITPNSLVRQKEVTQRRKRQDIYDYPGSILAFDSQAV